MPHPDVSPIRGSKSLAAELRTARNLRVFVHEALQRPEQGGHYYAIRALDHCSFLPTVVDLTKGKESAANAHAHKRLQVELNRCEGVLAQFGGLKGLAHNIEARPDRGRDPVRAVYQKLTRNQYGSAAEAVAAAIASEEPQLLFHAMAKYKEAIIEQAAGQKIEWTDALRTLAVRAAGEAAYVRMSNPDPELDAALGCLMTGQWCEPGAVAKEPEPNDPEERAALAEFRRVLNEFVAKQGRSAAGH